jgi:hypothetical protein
LAEGYQLLQGEEPEDYNHARAGEWYNSHESIVHGQSEIQIGYAKPELCRWPTGYFQGQKREEYLKRPRTGFLPDAFSG